MIQSMTAYARGEVKNNLGDVVLEMRSLNQRYFEACFRLPEQFRHLEPIFREKVRSCLIRGKIECNLFFEPNKNENLEMFSFNKSLAKQLINAANWIKQQSNNNKECIINLIDILQWPGILVDKESNINKITKDIISVFDNTLKNFILAREQEGDAIRKFIQQRLEIIQKEIKTLRFHMPKILQWQYKRLMSKLEAVSAKLEDNRLEQELAIIAQRMDVSEEIDRLEIHVKEVFNILKKNEAIGRRLDFMTQELNREANTLASKTVSIDVTNSAIELKVLIEQIREQIQNIE